MKYDTSNPLDVENARNYLDKLTKKGAIIEMKECRKRSLKQNNYLYQSIAYWGGCVGYTEEEAKQVYKWVNKDLYYFTKKVAGIEMPSIRHTYELSKEEMSLSIERWRNWAAANEVQPVYIPSPDDHRLVELMQMEVERNRMYL